MKTYIIRVSCMTASYTGEIEGNSKKDAIDRLRTFYRKNDDSRYNWTMTAREKTETRISWNDGSSEYDD